MRILAAEFLSGACSRMPSASPKDRNGSCWSPRITTLHCTSYSILEPLRPAPMLANSRVASSSQEIKCLACHALQPPYLEGLRTTLLRSHVVFHGSVPKVMRSASAIFRIYVPWILGKVGQDIYVLGIPSILGRSTSCAS